MYNALVAFPLQIACQLILPTDITYGNITTVVDTSALQKTTKLPEGFIAVPEIGVAYKYFNYKRPWNEARKACIKEGAYLAVIDTFKKVEQIMRIKPESVDPHVGIHRTFDAAEWTSVKTGLPITIEAWAPNRNLDKDWECMALWADGRGITADPCSYSHHFLCEIPLSMN